ncbi:MAG: DUF1257 domain-containing protein [Phycisphaerae bacterium]|nr:DUF1257 domain-containing protein [Phycisphaerae bacterium]
MSAVCVMTPLVIASWPVISAAVVGAAASMGFAVVGPRTNREEQTRQRGVETDVANSEVIAEQLAHDQKIVVHKGDVTITFAADERGRCTACVTGRRHSDEELRRIGEEVAGRVVQQFAYNKLVSELKSRDYSIVEEQVLSDESVRLRVRL